MNVAEFIKKWSDYTGKETSAYVEHFNDLCGILCQKTPVETDPTGNDFFCFQKRVIKDLELLRPDDTEAAKRGFADVWKQGHFGWEYKGKHKNLDEAYRQLQRYRESLGNPPLLVVCDFDRYIIRTNFNGTVPNTHAFTNAQLSEPKYLRLLRNVLGDPEALRPTRTTDQVTEELAAKIAAVARSLQEREAEEFEDARSGREKRVAQKKNLRIARFLNRLVFCFFAEDVHLLPAGLFTEVARTGLDDPRFFAEKLGELFRVMAGGGSFGLHKIRHFNGHLFEDATVFKLTDAELRDLADASEADWQFIQPSIMGTLFERALDADQRAQLGAHYTGEADIRTLVEPVLMAPLRREWATLRARLLQPGWDGARTPVRALAARRSALAAFQEKLATLTVLDPACGSGNFLYVSLQLLLGLEKEVTTLATHLGHRLLPRVGVHQLHAFEINSYAFELAQVTVQIGWLQWMRDNGFPLDRSPVLQTLDGFAFKDALLNQTFRKKHRSLAAAQAAEHEAPDGDDMHKVYTERAWPAADIIVGNPPFLGDKLMRRELGDEYVDALRETYSKRIPGQSDLCCYWFEKARNQIEEGKAKRAGLLATQSIRGGANGVVLNRIKETGDIFFAVSDRDWLLRGAAVHVALVGFDDGSEATKWLDGALVKEIGASLSTFIEFEQKLPLVENAGAAFIGTMKKGPLEISHEQAISMLRDSNPHGRPNSDVVRRWVSGLDISRRDRELWIIDFPMGLTEAEASCYAQPFEYLKGLVWSKREKHREGVQKNYWWRMARPCPDMRAALSGRMRFIATQAVGKHRYFVWVDTIKVPDQQAIVFALSGDAHFGVLASRVHELWVREAGKQLREAESGGRYNVTPCFETFPFPFPLREVQPVPDEPLSVDPVQAEVGAAKAMRLVVNEPPGAYGAAAQLLGLRAAIAEAARELDELRGRWLNPPEWTREEVLEFPASADGPWARFVDPTTVKRGVGAARYPRLVPKDEVCAAELARRTLTVLYNERPAWLRFAHAKLDAAVAAAYGWPADLSDEAILGRLLALNQERAAAEEKARRAAELTASGKPRKPQREKREDEFL